MFRVSYNPRVFQLLALLMQASFSLTLIAETATYNPETTVDIRAVGDSSYVGDWSEFTQKEKIADLKNSAKDRRPGNVAPPKFFQRRLAAFEPLRSPHLNILNLEASLTRKCTQFSAKEFQFATLPSSVMEFARFGFNVFGLANNHSLDCANPNPRGEINAAIKEVHKEFPKVLFHGVASNSTQLSQIATREINGVKIGIVSIKGWAMGAKQNVGNLSNRSRIFTALRDAKVDVRILLLHGGTELKRDPDYAMIRVAREFVGEFNGDLVFGHHPHVIQGFELLKKNNGRSAAIFYSLGNFLHDGLSRSQDGMLARVEVNKSGLIAPSLMIYPLANASWRPGPVAQKDLAKTLAILTSSNSFLASTLIRSDLKRIDVEMNDKNDDPKSPPSIKAAPKLKSEQPQNSIKLVRETLTE